MAKKPFLAKNKQICSILIGCYFCLKNYFWPKSHTCPKATFSRKANSSCKAIFSHLIIVAQWCIWNNFNRKQFTDKFYTISIMNKYPHSTFNAKAQYHLFVTRQKPSKMHLCVMKKSFQFNTDALLTRRGCKHDSK